MPRRATTTSSPTSSRRSRTTARSARSAARCASSSASTGLRCSLAALLLALLLAAPASAQMPGGATQSPAGALHRYYSASNTTHWVTPTPVAGDYAYEQTLGYLHTAPGPGRVAIFGCRSGGADYFLSAASNCEGTTILGSYGWMDTARVDALSVAVYRCLRPGIAHFASLDANCEGQTSEGRLG